MQALGSVGKSLICHIWMQEVVVQLPRQTVEQVESAALYEILAVMKGLPMTATLKEVNEIFKAKLQGTMVFSSRMAHGKGGAR